MVWYQPKSHSNASWDEDSSRYYVIFSILTWVAFAAGGLYFLSDFSVTADFSVDVFSNVDFTSAAVVASTLLVVASGFCGFVVSLPIVFVYRIVQGHIDNLQKRSWNVPTIRVSIYKSIPYTSFVVAHFVALSLSLGIAPQFARSLSERPTFLSSWTRLIYDEVFFPSINNVPEKLWSELFANEKTKEIIVLLPSSVLSTPNLLSETKKEIGEPFSVFLDSTNFAVELSQILEGGLGFQSRFHSPFLTASQLAPNRHDPVGAAPFSVAPAGAFFSPEYRSLSKLLGDDEITGDSAAYSVKTMIRRRLALSQPQLFLLFRTSWLRSVFDVWGWSELVVDDNYRLKEMLKTASSGDEGLKLFQLSELEQTDERVFHPMSGLRWPSTLKLTEKQQIIAGVDEALAAAVRELKKSGNKSLFILPYADIFDSQSLTSAYAFAHKPSVKNAVDEFIRNKSIVSTREISAFVRASLDADETQLPNSQVLTCAPIFFSFKSLEARNRTKEGLQRALWNFVGVDSDGSFSVVPDLKFFYKLEREYGAQCRGQIASLPKRRGLWLVRLDSNMSKQSVQGDGDETLRSLVFHAPRIAVEKSSRVPQRPQRAPSRSASQRANEIQKKDLNFVLYMLEEGDFGERKIVRAPEETKQVFYAQFEPSLSPVLDDISRGQLLWD